MNLTEPISQTAFGRLVGISQQAVSKQVERGVLVEGHSAAEWILAYCDQLREQAAGRGGEDQYQLTQEKARQARADADLKELQFWREIGRLVSVDDLEPVLAAWATMARAQVENAVERAVAAIESKHDLTIERALVDGPFDAALAAIAQYPTGSGVAAGPDGAAVEPAAPDSDTPVAG